MNKDNNIIKEELSGKSFDFPTCLKFIVKKNGLCCLNDIKIINILSDLQALNQHPAIRNIYKILISEGIIKRIFQKSSWDFDCDRIVSKVENEYAFTTNLTKYILQCVLYANSSINKKPVLEKDGNFVIKTNQDNNNIENINLNHSELTFKGLKLGGDIDDFIVKLKNKGFSYPQISQGKIIKCANGTGLVIMYGSYAGCQESEITIRCSLLDKKILSLTAIPKIPIQWEELNSFYERIKNALIRKYGSPSQDVFEFEFPYSLQSSNRDKLKALKNSKGFICCRFENNNWNIHLSLDSRGIFVNYKLNYDEKILLDTYMDKEI